MAALGDDLDRRQVLLGGLVGAGEILHALAEQIENAADAVFVQVDGRGDRVVEAVTGNEPVNCLAGQRVSGNGVFQPGISGGPQEQLVHHVMTPFC